MNDTIIVVLIFAEPPFRKTNLFASSLWYLALDRVWLKSSSCWESRRIYCDCQARTRRGELILPPVNWSFVHLCIMFNVLHCVIYVFPQLNNVDYKSSQNCGFINMEIKEECSSDFSNYSKYEGNPALQIALVSYCFHLDAFILI